MKNPSRLFAAAVACGLLLVSGSFPAAEPSFATPPSATAAGKGLKVSFAASAPTDVEVAILDAQGRVVRHLAAGVLAPSTGSVQGGKNPPPEPLKAGLAQTLEWDGADDLGRPAAGGPFAARVRLGLRAELDGFIGETRMTLNRANAPSGSGITGMATDSQGRLYLLQSPASMGHQGSFHVLNVFDRKGEYIKTLMPMPANLPRDKAAAFGPVDVPGKGLTPRNYLSTLPQLYPQPIRHCRGLLPRVTGKGHILLSLTDGLVGLDPDGVPCDPRHGWRKVPDFMGREGLEGTWAVSPDGRTLYLAGHCTYNGDWQKGFTVNPARPDGRVYRVRLDDKPEPEKFVDLYGEADYGRLTRKGEFWSRASRGVACDRAGNVLVCDGLNRQICVFDPQGKQIGTLAAVVKIGDREVGPEQVFVSALDGAVYVLAGETVGYHKAPRSLLKFKSWQDPQPVARHDFGDTDYSAVMALDDSAAPAVLWLTLAGWHTKSLYRVEDRGNAFELEDLGRQDLPPEEDRLGPKIRLAVHPETEHLLYMNGAEGVRAVEGLTGAPVPLPFKNAGDATVGLDGNWYIQTGWRGNISRYDRRFAPLAGPGKPAGSVNVVGFVTSKHAATHGTAGMAVDANGRLIAVQNNSCAPVLVMAFGPDGTVENHSRSPDAVAGYMSYKPLKELKGGIIGSLGGSPPNDYSNIQLDWRGNIYIGMRVKPEGQTPPAGFEKDEAWSRFTGSVVKFGPTGGEVYAKGQKGRETPPPGAKGLAFDKGIFLENAQRAYFGMGSMSGGNFGGVTVCSCMQPMFQLDGYGRLYIPHALTYSVKIVDNQDNPIAEFGEYGNADSRGPGEGSLIKTPAIPFGWPIAVAASDQAIYVADVLNQRIVRLLKKYAVEETCRAK